jgi:DNA replication protein DnaC
MKAQHYADDRSKYLRLLRDDPEKLESELARSCPWCERRLPLRVFEGWKGKQIVPVVTCGCEGERAGLAKEAERRRREHEEFEREKWAKTLQQAGLVGWLADATFESYRAREDWPSAKACKVAVEAYATALLGEKLGSKPWLILHGQYGTGKSHLAAAVVHKAIEQGMRGCFFRVWPQYLKRLQASWERQPGEERTGDIVSELQRGRLVAIDDLDKKQPSRSGWAEDELFAALNYRYNEQAPTILTFNHGPDDPYVLPNGKRAGVTALEAYLGRAALDRISGAAFDMVEFDGASFRSGVAWG